VKLLDAAKDWLWGKNPELTLEAPRPRADNWQNPLMGYGTSRDKLTAGFHGGVCRLSDWELSSLYYSDDIAAKLVEKRPEEAFRRGYKLCSKTDEEGAQELQKKGKALGLDAKMQEAFTWARAWGGALLILGVDGGDPATPLEDEKARDIKFLNVVDRRFVAVRTWYSDPLKPNFGEAETYSIGSINQQIAVIHESRVIRFDGPPVDPLKRRELGGWTYSVLQRPYDVMRVFATAFQAAGVLTSDASQAVFTIKGLFEMIASKEKERLQTRMALVDMTRSAGRALLLDADGEKFERVKTDFSGYPEMLDRLSARLAASVDMPVTILMGTSPGGQNATGESDFRHWYDSIASQQGKELTPKLLRVYSILARGMADGLEVEWLPLYEPTDQERAQTSFTQAQADGIYIDKGVVIPEQVAIARFGSGNGRISIDEEQLVKSIGLEKKFSGLLEKARGSLGEKELAALSIAQGVSPIIVSSLIQATGSEPGPAVTPAPGAGAPPVKKEGPPDGQPDAKPGIPPGGSTKP
jgi:phage-related protein (TIGR01555 family)